ncbi:uncharacterized protein Z519_03498 [Cladophialophora bantiana CBS 173.52]|uniref:Calcineurin-like phosphoesterase domain-containing protein n=1 Tax=Cladophialophora bantiana (strain ATCC 10958 / CBS 173.52 / CDC B-1940 / NIH 8579) TaxID=1442370 RepID=A0A0D2II63_CLAB1|nr:uncharacterized protein Z519_03498 [Cladophialophora bantiana CBS 173.52]KIW96429.1 hypothetical protein Z519_03498 [Cladophialophora bantiana CBS 173.52]
MTTRRTRIVCISDTHNQTPHLPAGHVLIHAGDLTNQGTYSELQKTVDWIKKAQFQIKIVVCGNHDVTCDVPFYQMYGGYFHNKRREDPQRCLDLLRSDPSLVFLNHEATQVRINHGDGLVSLLKIFGSPYSPAHGFWAFGYSPETAPQLWDQIPLDSDVVVTHTPAKFHCDECGNRGTAGCEILREALWRVRPRLFVCGHIHEAYGVEAVTWDLSSPNLRYKERSVRRWADPDPSSKKQFTVDLSSRAKSLALRNDGSIGNLIPSTQLSRLRGVGVDGTADDASTDQQDRSGSLPNVPSPPTPPFPDFGKAQRPAPSTIHSSNVKHLGTTGQGGPASSSRSDQEAISGREGRVETCMVNAAYMGSNWPHRGGKKFHKPVVIDLDLPIVDVKEIDSKGAR